REVAVPGVAKFLVAPGPLLLTGRNVMVGIMDNPGLGVIVVSAEKILFASHAHIGSGHGNVGVEGEVIGGAGGKGVERIPTRYLVAYRDELARGFGFWDTVADALAVIHSIIVALAAGVLAHGTSGMVRHVRNVRGKKALIGFMNAGSDVGPPKKGLDE